MNTKVRKLVPSRKPTAFGPATALSRNSGSGSSRGGLGPGLDDEERHEQGHADGEHGDGPGGGPADLRRLGDGVDEHQEGGGNRYRPEGVITPLSAGAALRHHCGHQGEGRYADRDVEEEDVLPSGVAGEDSAGQQADRTAQCAHRAPDAESLVAFGPLGEHVHHDRLGGRQYERRPESLQPAHHDEEGVRGGQAASERGGGEDCHADHENAAASEQVSGAAAEEQETGEGQPVGGHQPLQVGFGEVERAADGRQGDVHDREIHDRDEVGHDQQRERFPPLPGQPRRPAGLGPGRWAGGLCISGRGVGGRGVGAITAQNVRHGLLLWILGSLDRWICNQ
jgi:hypothetical protein